jgi:hypothetical protein
MARPGWGAGLFAAGWMSWTFGSTLCAIALTSYQQATCPARLRGRVSAASRWVNWGPLPLGGLAGGAFGAVLGVHTALWVAVIAVAGSSPAWPVAAALAPRFRYHAERGREQGPVLPGHRYRNFAAHSHGWDSRHAHHQAGKPCRCPTQPGIRAAQDSGAAQGHRM